MEDPVIKEFIAESREHIATIEADRLEIEVVGTSFNADTLLRQLNGDSDLATLIVQVFLKNSPAQIRNLRTAVLGDDAPSAAKLAHLVRGSAGAVGGASLQRLALEMESAGRSAQLDALRTLLPRIEMEFESLRKALEAYLSEIHFQPVK